MNDFIKYIGLDVHKETIAVSVTDSQGGEARNVGESANTQEAVRKLIRRLGESGTRLMFCYEAGPCGYVIRPITGISNIDTEPLATLNS